MRLRFWTRLRLLLILFELILGCLIHLLLTIIHMPQQLPARGPKHPAMNIMMIVVRTSGPTLRRSATTVNTKAIKKGNTTKSLASR